MSSSPVTRLIVVRHGESMANKQCIFAGHTDVDLTKLGKKQAELVCGFLCSCKYKIDKIYSSDLSRAYNTVFPAAEKLGLEIIKDENLREIYAGKWEGATFESLKENFPESYNTWMTNIQNARCDGGESVGELAVRIKNEIDRIISQNKGKTILIASHGTPIRIMSALWKGVELSDIQNVAWVPNASVSVAEYYNSSVSIPLYGYCDYLENFKTFLPANV